MPSATPAQLESLLEIQRHDTAIDRLTRLLSDLPQGPRLAERNAELEAVNVRLSAIDEEIEAASRQERHLDDEATMVRERATEVERHLYDGTVTSPRELLDLQADIEQLNSQRNRLEDRELEYMEKREVLTGQRDEIVADHDAALALVEGATEALRDAEAENGVELRRQRDARTVLAGDIESALLVDYDGRRERNRGIGIARLVGNTCATCGVAIPAVEVDAFRHSAPGSICTPEDCRCILVPTWSDVSDRAETA